MIDCDSHRLFPLRIVLLLAVSQAVIVLTGMSAAQEGRQEVDFFEKQIRPLLVERCYECHAGEEKSGGLRLDSREGWMAGGDSGPSLIPGKPDESRIIEAVRYRNLDLQMPPSGRLSDAQVAALEKWVSLGAPDPRTAQEGSKVALGLSEDSSTDASLPSGEDPPSETASSSSRAPMGMSVEDARRFWSFRPVANPPVPIDVGADWVRTPVDAFLLSSLKAAGLAPAPEADKRTLIRRVTFDLIGLPPTPNEVDDFMADDAPDSFDRVVERLLGSPQYGERWGRHWLDVARYADSNGLDENLAFGNAWRYRDYVVQAFNSDKPLNRFLVEQIAGDLLPDSNRETLTATGFLVLGAKVLAEPDREKLTMDTIDEQIDTTGKAFLGMTLGCARCHDHKFDPIQQSDYYALAAIFKSTGTFADTNTGAIRHWNEHSLATDDQLERLKEIDAAIAEKKTAATKFKNEAMAKLRNEAIRNAAKYLAAASQFSPTATLNEVEAIANPLGLHPRILQHCRLHLEYHREEVLPAQWHSLLDAGADPAVVEQHFQEWFDEAAIEDRSAKQVANDDSEHGSGNEERLEAVRAALSAKEGFLVVPPQPQFAFDGDTLEQFYRLEEEARIAESEAEDEPAVMSVRDDAVLVSLPIHIRGNHRNLGEPVVREFPQAMRTSTVRPVFPRNQSGRLELAEWMASSQHPLTARVYVNRLWRWHFGQGIVGSTENFGALGDPPSHPVLLAWLARYFMESGWSTKQFHRLLLSSSAYQLSSSHPDEGRMGDIDPENRLLWKFPPQRVEAEQIRDALLAVSGRLDAQMGGKTVPLRNRQFVFNHTSVDHTRYDSLRRALYLPVIRNNLYPLFEQFNFPDPTMPTGSRQATVVAPQALLMLNDELVMDAAAALARRVCENSSLAEQRVDEAYRLALARPPSEFEMRRAIEFVARIHEQLSARRQKNHEQMPEHTELARLEAWSLFCHSLFASNEFIYLK